MEAAPQACQDCGEENICHKRHHRYIHIRRVDVVSRRQEGRCILLLAHLAIGAGCRSSDMCLLARPRFVSPGKEHKRQFGKDVCIGHIEVVLQCRDGHVAVQLS